MIWQAAVQTNDCLVYWRISASLNLDQLRKGENQDMKTTETMYIGIFSSGHMT